VGKGARVPERLDQLAARRRRMRRWIMFIERSQRTWSCCRVIHETESHSLSRENSDNFVTVCTSRYKSTPHGFLVFEFLPLISTPSFVHDRSGMGPDTSGVRADGPPCALRHEASWCRASRVYIKVVCYYNASGQLFNVTFDHGSMASSDSDPWASDSYMIRG
jgi:hypothetical protein